MGASREDGTGGSERLARESRANPTIFIRLRKGESGREGASLARIVTDGGKAPVNMVAEGVLDIIVNLAPPTVFYVRLLNREHEAYARVEKFFRSVVDPSDTSGGSGLAIQHSIYRAKTFVSTCESSVLKIDPFNVTRQV